MSNTSELAIIRPVVDAEPLFDAVRLAVNATGWRRGSSDVTLIERVLSFGRLPPTMLQDGHLDPDRPPSKASERAPAPHPGPLPASGGETVPARQTE